MEEDKSIAKRVIQAVARETGKDPLELSPLGDEIAVDALNQLGNSSEITTIQFNYAGYTVTVRSDKTTDILLTPHIKA